MLRLTVAGMLSAVLLSGLAAPAQAAGYPERPLRMVVGFPPGGSSDIAARVFAEAMSERLGQPVVVENKPGAGGNIAAAEVIRAKPDGYTVFYATSAIILGPLVYPSAKYDAITEFSPVALTASNPLVFVVNNDIPPRSLSDFVSWAKQQGNLNYVSTGAGTMTHLPAAAFVKEFGIDAVHVPHRGASPAMVDLGNGSAQFMISALSEALPMIQAGKIRPLAITSGQRSPLFPDVPTVKEAVGSSNFLMGGWQALVLPAGADPKVVQRLNDVVNDTIKDPAVQKRFAPQGTELLGGDVQTFRDFMGTERVRWQKIVEDAGARAD